MTLHYKYYHMFKDKSYIVLDDIKANDWQKMCKCGFIHSMDGKMYLFGKEIIKR